MIPKFFGAVFLAILCIAALLLTVPVYAQSGGGDPAAAEKYVAWAEKALNEGRWAEALAGLERAADYGDVSSDISYLLALARSRQGRPQGAVLESLRSALEVKRWQRYSAGEARLLEAKTLIRLRAFNEALQILSLVPESIEAACLRLNALRFLPEMEEYRRYMAVTLNRYPRESEIARILLDQALSAYAAGGNPQGGDTELITLVLRRLPQLLPVDPELAWRAAPFMRDIAEARRIMSAYRAGSLAPTRPVPASIPAALNLGLIDEETAVTGLFELVPRSIDKELLRSVWNLLRHDEGRSLFRRNLSSFSGVIREDADSDGIFEASAHYRNGMLIEYSYDADQDGLPEMALFFEAGSPVEAVLVNLPDAENAGNVRFALPVKDEERSKLGLRWERYPAVLEARMGEFRFIPRPNEFFFSPVRFRDFLGSGLLFPERDALTPRISRRTLVSFAIMAERPSAEFRGGIEQIELNASIPIRAREFLDGRLVSETEFLRGRPQLQRIDLDLDGRPETVRHFRRTPSTAYDDPSTLLDYLKDFDYADTDRDGDGIFEIRQK